MAKSKDKKGDEPKDPVVIDKGNGKTVTKNANGSKLVTKVKEKGDGSTVTVDKKVNAGGKVVKKTKTVDDGKGGVNVTKTNKKNDTTVSKVFEDGYLVSKEKDAPGKKGDQVYDQSAEIARQLEDQRVAKIKSGEGLINDAFKVFDDNYFNQYQQDYLAHYNPQIDKQFTRARQDLRYNLARARTQDSTAGQRNFGDLVAEYTKQRANTGANALTATNTLRGNVDQQKNALYDQNMSAADPTKAAQMAAGQVGALKTTPAYNPIGDLFAGAIRGGTAYVAGRQQGLPAGYA